MPSFESALLWGRGNTVLKLYNSINVLLYTYDLGVPDEIGKLGYELVFGDQNRIDLITGEQREGNVRGWRFVYEATWLNQENLLVQRVLFAINYAAKIELQPHADVNHIVEVIRPTSFFPQYAFNQTKALDLTLKLEGRYVVSAIPMTYIDGN